MACDLNAVGVAERVREFAALGVERRACRRRSHPAGHRRLAVETALRHFGRLDVVVNVAGGLTTYGPIGEAHGEPTSTARSPSISRPRCMVSQAAIEALARRTDRIVNFASIAYFEPQKHGGVSRRQGRRGGIHPEPRAGARRGTSG